MKNLVNFRSPRSVNTLASPVTLALAAALTLSACASANKPRTASTDAAAISLGATPSTEFKAQIHEMLADDAALSPEQRSKLENIIESAANERLRLRGVTRHAELALIKGALGSANKKELKKLRKEIHQSQEDQAKLTEKTIDDFLTVIGKNTKVSQATIDRLDQMMNRVQNLREH